MKRRNLHLGWVVILIFSAATFLIAAQNGVPPLAATTDGQLTLYGLNGGAQPVTSGWIVNPVWSPDGQHLAFTVNNGGATLMLTDRSGSAPITLAQNIASLPATFSADSSQVIYAVEGASEEITTSPGGIPELPVRVFAQDLSPSATPTQIGEFGFGVGCGGGSPFPMDLVYNVEAGFGGRALTFIRTDYGILYSTTCAGIGLGLLDTATGESVLLSSDASRATLSPDGTRVAAVRGTTLVVLDLASGGQQSVATQTAPDQLAWANNSALYYSARYLMESPLPLSSEEAQAINARYGLPADGVPQYMVSIAQVGLSGGESQVYREPGWAVGRMFVSGGSLYFSLVPNGEAWVEALVNGQSEQQAAAVTLFRLNGDGSASEVGTGIGQATLHPSG